MYNGSFHEAVGFLLAIGQIFGVMPVSGVRGKSPKRLAFRKFSIRFIYCVSLCVALVWLISLEILWINKTKLTFDKLINCFFDWMSLISILFFLELATKWPELISKWQEVEEILPQLRYQMDKQKLAYEIKMVSLVILFVSMGELFMSCY